MATSNGEQSYRLSMSQAITDKLQALRVMAEQRDVRRELADAQREMLRQLRYSPTDWGDPHFDFHDLGMTRYQKTGPLLLFLDAIHHASRTVYLQDVLPRPGSVLDVNS